MTGSPAWPTFSVLCVDDNRDGADSAVLLLQAVGFEARACYDGKTALEIIEKIHPSVCLIDLHMPGMDGDEVVKELRRQSWCPLLLVAVTAMSDEKSRQRINAAGFHLHLVKPVDPQQLLKIVDLLFQIAHSGAASEKTRVHPAVHWRENSSEPP
jgi:two-component system OmpR family response regulator